VARPRYATSEQRHQHPEEELYEPSATTLIVPTVTLVNDLSAAQFVTINVDGTVTSNDTCVVMSLQYKGSSRFHNFYASQLYRAYVTTCCHVGSVEL